jgi:hypothetical protein
MGAARAAHHFQNSESWTAEPFDGIQGFGSSGTFDTSIGSETVDSSMTGAPATVLTFVSARHYAESEPMPSAAAPIEGQPSRRTMGCAEQLRLF